MAELLMQQKEPISVKITDLISGEIMIVTVFENQGSVLIGNKIVNVAQDQLISMLEIFQQHLNFIKPLEKMEVKNKVQEPKMEIVKTTKNKNNENQSKKSKS